MCSQNQNKTNVCFVFCVVGVSSCQSRCIQIDVSKLDNIEISGTTVTVGAGVRLDALYIALANVGLFFPGGACKRVGVGGHLQSSALGFMTRSFGMSTLMRLAIQMTRGVTNKYNRFGIGLCATHGRGVG